jgi:hypothetical protein
MKAASIVTALGCAWLAACAPKLTNKDVVGVWSAHDGQHPDAAIHIQFRPDGSFTGRVPGVFVDAPTSRAPDVKGAWTLIREDGRQKVQLDFKSLADDGGDFIDQLFVLGGDGGGLRLTEYRGDPDEDDTVDFKKQR